MHESSYERFRLMHPMQISSVITHASQFRPAVRCFDFTASTNYTVFCPNEHPALSIASSENHFAGETVVHDIIARTHRPLVFTTFIFFYKLQMFAITKRVYFERLALSELRTRILFIRVYMSADPTHVCFYALSLYAGTTHVYFKRDNLFGNRIQLSAYATHVYFNRVEMSANAILGFFNSAKLLANTTYVYFSRLYRSAIAIHVYINRVKLFANTIQVYFNRVKLFANPNNIYGRASQSFANAIHVYFRLEGIISGDDHINVCVKCFIGKLESIQSSLSYLFVGGGITFAGNTNEYQIVSDVSAIGQKRMLSVTATKKYKLTFINK